jgi:regulatory protein
VPDEQWRAQPGGATVVSVEAHPKQPHMYRLVCRTEDDAQPEALQRSESTSDDNRDWADEVDALIASAHSGSAGIETLLTVHEDTLVSWRLLKGRRLSAEEWAELQREEQKEEAYRAALGILERKARTTRELSDALKRKGFAADVIAGCLERLASRSMLDDAAFAKRFAEQRVVTQRKGSRLVRQELLQRGIARDEAERALGEVNADSEKQAALTLARKRWPLTKGEPRERKMKLLGYLLRRGFPNGIAHEAVREISAQSDAEGEWHDPSDVVEEGEDGWM